MRSGTVWRTAAGVCAALALAGCGVSQQDVDRMQEQVSALEQQFEDALSQIHTLDRRVGTVSDQMTETDQRISGIDRRKVDRDELEALRADIERGMLTRDDVARLRLHLADDEE